MSNLSLIYGTGNPAKLQHMRDMLAPLNIEIIGLMETGISVPEVDESGNTPLENARIKALAYFKIFNRPVFSCDSGFYIDGLPDSEQPGVHVRRVNGRSLSDEEMTAHYAEIAARLGGKATCQYKNAICLIINANEIYEHFGDDISGELFYIVSKPHPKRVKGFPFDCISVHIESGKYYYDLERPEGISITMEDGFRAFFNRVLNGGMLKCGAI